MKTIDTSGMSCPQPVLMTKKALEQHKEGVEVLVDNNTAKANVTRFLNNAGYKVIETKQGELTSLKAQK
ncbi:MAG: sulfurtransferase TusA family protein [Bacillota bacterium]|nr:sulfurtransferase TusA family protein [Bacillota bacterium]